MDCQLDIDCMFCLIILKDDDYYQFIDIFYNEL